MIHYAAWGVAAVVGKVGALVGKGAVVAHHFVAAHALATAAVGTGSIATIAYVDHEVLRRWYVENPPPAKMERSVKFAIGGKLLNGEFTTIIDNRPVTAVLQGLMDEGTQEIVKSRIVKPRRLSTELTNALAGGQMLVYD